LAGLEGDPFKPFLVESHFAGDGTGAVGKRGGLDAMTFEAFGD
jgi:hypothetical protein